MKNKCRVCGLNHNFFPWGDDDKTPSFEICDCCGVEFGYEDSTKKAILNYRKKWIESGAKWFQPRKKPKDWDLESQLTQISCKKE